MAPIQGLFIIENKLHGLIGPEGTPKPGQPSPVIRIYESVEAGRFRIEPTPDGITYYIVALKEGEYDAADIGAALFVRAPDGVQYQTWFILHNTTDDSYMIVKSDNHAHWELSSSTPGTQVLCEGGHDDEVTKIIHRIIRERLPLSDHAANINQNAFWRLTQIGN